MFRRLAPVALLLLLAVAASAASAADKNWLLAQVTPTGDSAMCILKMEMKDGKPTPTVVWAPANTEIALSDFSHSGSDLLFTIKTTRTIPASGDNAARTLPAQAQTFVGVFAGDHDKPILGSLGDDRFLFRAKITPTDKTALEPNERLARAPEVAAYRRIVESGREAAELTRKWQAEKDAAAKRELQQKMTAARAEQQKALPGLHRAVVEESPDSAPAVDSALFLLRGRHAADAAEAGKLIALIEKQSTPYGPRFVRYNMAQAAEMAALKAETAAAALPAIEPIAKTLTEKDKASEQVRILGIYKSALDAAGRAADAKSIDARLAKLENVLDQEYLATVPPFKPEPYAGRKEKSANQVVAFELFTGAQCPPCVAADVGFDALEKAYSPKDVVLIQYHMHIPGPDPMTNPSSMARWDYYKAKFPEGIRGTPSTLFNGKPAAGGGGGMANSESKHKQYRDLIDPLLEKTSPVTITGKATRNGDKIEIAAEVAGATPAGEDLKLRFILVEEKVKYVGGNGLRFHHQVVRGLPGGAAGVVVKEKNFRHVANADVADLKAGLGKYLEDFSAERKNTWKAKPMDLGHLKVVVLVQNDESRQIVQAAMFDVEGK